MKYTEYFMEITGLPFFSREKASPSVSSRVVCIYICLFRDCMKLGALKMPGNVLGMLPSRVSDSALGHPACIICLPV